MNVQKSTYASYSNLIPYFFISDLIMDQNGIYINVRTTYFIRSVLDEISYNCVTCIFSRFSGIEIIASKCYHASGVITITIMFEVSKKMTY